MEKIFQTDNLRPTPLISTIDLLQRELEMQEKTIENLRNSIRNEVVVKSVRAVRCPNCNAPITKSIIKKRKKFN